MAIIDTQHTLDLVIGDCDSCAGAEGRVMDALTEGRLGIDDDREGKEKDGAPVVCSTIWVMLRLACRARSNSPAMSLKRGSLTR
jgi:hypothetical protein